MLIERLENDPNLTVVVFRSEKPGYFMAHWDFLADHARVVAVGAVPGGGPPGNRPFTQLLFDNGLQQADGLEIELGSAVGKLRRNL